MLHPAHDLTVSVNQFGEMLRQSEVYNLPVSSPDPRRVPAWSMPHGCKRSPEEEQYR